MSMTQILDCQQRLADLLNADPFFNDPDPAKRIVAITQRKADLASEIAQALTKIGAGVIVTLPRITWNGEAERISLQLHFSIVVTENPSINRAPGHSGKAAEEIIANVMRVVHWKPNSAGSNPRVQANLFKLDSDVADLFEPPPAMPTMQINYRIRVSTNVNL